jgi:hypothetical protein
LKIHFLVNWYLIDNHHFLLSEIADGLLIDRISKNESGMYICMGSIPLPDRIITSFYPILIFVSDPLCKKIWIQFFFSILYFLFRRKKKKKETPRNNTFWSSNCKIRWLVSFFFSPFMYMFYFILLLPFVIVITLCFFCQ